MSNIIEFKKIGLPKKSNWGFFNGRTLGFHSYSGNNRGLGDKFSTSMAFPSVCLYKVYLYNSRNWKANLNYRTATNAIIIQSFQKGEREREKEKESERLMKWK